MNIIDPVLHANGLPVLNSKLIRINKSNMNSITQSRINMMVFMLLILITISFVATTAHAANLLFRSNLGSGISLGPLYNFSTNGAWQAVNGTDKETGYTWPVSALGSDFSGVQLITVDPITSSTIGNYITNQIIPVTGPKGDLINELSQQVKIKLPVGAGGTQAPFLINRPWKIGDVNDLYITYWFRYQADLETQLDATVPGGNWRAHFEFKTGGYNNTWMGDYRITVYVVKGGDGKLYWLTKGDNVANGPFTPVDYWIETNRIAPIPIDKWSKFEVYWHRSGGSDGRFWVAIDGEVIVDHHGPNMGDYKLPITRIFISNPYSGGHATVDNHTTGLQIWNGFPCGEGMSCYNFDTVAPTIPSSVAAKISKYTTAAGVALTWGASSDNVGVAGYNIYRNGTKIGVTTTNKFNDVITGTAKGTLYSYTVKAFDAEDNLSTVSTAALVTY
ncbi:MAG: hypothetical protein HRU78_10515 [Gammaproteobacteria bacterium]|nr:MAG: hypothetical protein HRU78_10515 [Gammaproteobacteria bacterium]